VAGVDAQLASLQKAKTDAEVLAPAAGVVTQKLTEAGELASPRTPLVVITDLEHAWANLFVPEPMIPRIRLGQAATVFTDAGGPGVPGTITFISPTAEFTPRNVQTSEEDDRSSYDRQRRQLVCVLKSAPVDADIPLP
jgi:HlyD family secretion protein